MQRTMTLMFTDIVGSSRLWDTDPIAMSKALMRHDRIVSAIAEEHSGQVFATTGDGFGIAFDLVSDAVEAAVTVQPELLQCPSSPALRVRAGIHTGFVEERSGNFYGPTVNYAARLTRAAHGGQVLISQTAASLLPNQSLAIVGDYHLEGLTKPIRIYQIVNLDCAKESDPLRCAHGATPRRGLANKARSNTR